MASILTDEEIDQLLNPPIVDVYDVLHKGRVIFSFDHYPTSEEVFTHLFYDWGTPFEDLTLTEVRKIIINRDYSVIMDRRRKD